MKRVYTSHLTPEVRKLLGTIPDTKLAKIAGVTRERIRQYRELHHIRSYTEVRRLTEKRQYLDAIVAARFVSLWNTDVSFDEIMEAFNWTAGDIVEAARVLRDSGYNLKERHLFANKREVEIEAARSRFVQLWNSGESVDGIMKKLGVVRTSVYAYTGKLRKLGYVLRDRRVK